MFQMGSLGPMLGQTHHFVKFNAGKSAYAEDRYRSENRRLYQVLDARLKAVNSSARSTRSLTSRRGHGFPDSNGRRWTCGSFRTCWIGT